MASSAVVGVLRAILSADTAQFDTSMKRSAQQVTAFGEQTTRAAAGIAKSLSGQKLIKDATDTAEAIRLIGGTSKLTAAEAGRMEAKFSQAFEKMKLMGVQVPPDLLKTQAALKQVADQAEKASGSSLSLGVALGTIAGNLVTKGLSLAASEISRMAGQAAKLDGVQASFTRLSTAMQQDGGRMLSALQTGTQGLVENVDLMQAANKAMLLGLPVTTQSMGQLANAATTLGRAMGLDATTSLDNLITALGRSSPMILDNLGITVRLEEANRHYAESVGKSADALTEAERKIAFYQEAMRKAQQKTTELGEHTLTLTESLSASWVSVANVVESSFSRMNKAMGQRFQGDLNDPTTVFGALRGWKHILSTGSRVDEQLGDKPDTTRAAAFITPLVNSLRSASDATKEFDAANGTLAQQLAKVQSVIDKQAEAVKRLEEEYQKFKREAITGVTDAQRRQLDMEVRLLQEGHSQLALMKFKIGSWQELTKAIKAHNVELGKAPPGPIDTRSLLGGGLAIGGRNAGVVLGPAPPDLTRMKEYVGLLGQSLDVTEALGQAGGRTWQLVFGFVRQGIAMVMQYIAASAAAKLAENARAAASAAANAAATMGISLAVQGVLAWMQYSDAQDAAAREALIAFKKMQEELKKLGLIGADVGLRLRGTAAAIGTAIARPFESLTVTQQYQKLLDGWKKASEDITVQMGRLTSITERFGGVAPAALRPFIADLLKSTRLTQEQRDLLESMSGEPTWQYLQETAEQYGISLDSLGSKFQQTRLGAMFDDIFTHFTQLTDAGADSNAVLTGMADEVQALLNNAMKFGSALPEFMRPMLEQMLQLGLLTDDAGNALGDLSRFKFTDSIESSFKRMADVLEQIRDLLAFGLPAAAGAGARGIGNALSGLGKIGFGVMEPSVRMPTQLGYAGVDYATSVPVSASGQTMTFQLFQDARQTAEAIVPWLPGATKRYAVGR